MYDDIAKALLVCTSERTLSKCSKQCPYHNKSDCRTRLMIEAADAIEELLKAAKAMHTWIFLNTGDEQAAYDECGLTDEMNAMLGYGGQFVAEPPKEET